MSEIVVNVNILEEMRDAGFPHCVLTTNMYGYMKLVFEHVGLNHRELSEALEILRNESNGIEWGFYIDTVNVNKIRITFRSLDHLPH